MSDDAKEKKKRIDGLKTRWTKLDGEQKDLAALINERKVARETLVRQHAEQIAALKQQLAAAEAEHKAKIVAFDTAVENAREARAMKKELAGDISYAIEQLGETWPPQQ